MLTASLIDIPFIEIFIIIFSGLIFGSFAGALVYRVPRNEPWAFKGANGRGVRSACPACGTPLKPIDLMPIVSWIIQKGRCRYCNAAISKIYPICETLTLAGFIGVYTVYGFTYFSLAIFLAVPFLVALVMIDFKHMILPNQLVAILAVLGTILLGMRLYLADDLTQTTIFFVGGALLFATIALLLQITMKKLLKRDALGMGDVKFFAVTGLWLGASLLGQFCVLSGLCGVLIGISWQVISKNQAFPFGPALVFAFYTLILYQGSQM